MIFGSNFKRFVVPSLVHLRFTYCKFQVRPTARRVQICAVTKFARCVSFIFYPSCKATRSSLLLTMFKEYNSMFSVKIGICFTGSTWNDRFVDYLTFTTREYSLKLRPSCLLTAFSNPLLLQIASPKGHCLHFSSTGN